MSNSFHICVDVKGVLKLTPKEFHKEYNGVFSGDNGRVLSDKEARDALLEELAKGHRVIPSNGCDNFDFQKGCLGHEHEEVTQ